MTDFDPFATAPADDEAQAEPTPAQESPWEEPKKSVGEVTVDVKPNFVGFPTEGKIVTTLKAGSGYDAPWVVIHAASVEESDKLLDQSFADYLSKVKRVAGFFSGGSNGAAQGGNTNQRQNAPQGATQPPAWFPPPPAEGWVYKTGFKKDGSGAWHAWAPARKGEGDWKFHNPPK